MRSAPLTPERSVRFIRFVRRSVRKRAQCVYRPCLGVGVRGFAPLLSSTGNQSMTLPRIAACFTIPAALLLSACGGGSSSPFVNNATQGTAQVRFVQADPKFGPLDIYFFQSAGSQTTTPAFSSLAFGEASDYQPQTAVPNTLVARTAGSASSGPGVTACNLPPLTNANYSIVIADQNGAPNCMVFQDQNYSTTLQYRMHYAASLYAAANPAFASV